MSTAIPFGLITRAVVGGLALAFILVLIWPQLLPREQPVVQVQQSGGHAITDAGPFSYADAVAQASPAVVNIYSAKVVNRSGRDPLLRYFFGEGRPQQQRQTSLGSGVIIAEQGYVLTNNHVIDGASEIQVSLVDGRRLTASVVGRDPETDLAVLRIAARDLPSIVIAEDKPPRVGDVALAIGNPYGVGQAVSMGIVSATGRDQLGINTFENFIQTDAAINPGNSGGALINALGELIGINTVIYTESGGSDGIGFAIPASLAMGVMQQIVEHGHAVRGWLGVEAQTITPPLAASFGLPDVQGVVIAGVFEDGPAAVAGLRPGDVITHIDGDALLDARSVLNVIARNRPGTRLALRGLRDGDEREWSAVISQRPVQ